MKRSVPRICTICARGGSRGVPGKNLRELGGKPLLAHAVLQAVDSRLFAAIAVSSDSDEILEAATRWGAHHAVRRPPDLASDQAPKIPAIRHCVLEVEKRTGQPYAVIVDLDVTTPLRSLDDIKQSICLLEEKNASIVISGSPARRSPYFNLAEMDARGAVWPAKTLSTPVFRRQDSPRCYDINGSIDVWKREALFTLDSVYHEDTRLYIMPEERAWDIDSELDWEVVEFLFRRQQRAEA